MQDKLKITISNHGRTFSAELPFDAGLPEILQVTAGILASIGWSKDSIAGFIRDEDDSTVWEWDV